MQEHPLKKEKEGKAAEIDVVDAELLKSHWSLENKRTLLPLSYTSINLFIWFFFNKAYTQ